MKLAQSSAPPSDGTAQTLTSDDLINSQNGRWLPYVPFVGVLAALFILASPRLKAVTNLHFHAMQSLFLFAAWMLIEWPLEYVDNLIPGLDSVLTVLKLAVLGGWVFALIKGLQGRDAKLPMFSEFAQRSVEAERSPR
jgi:uncharacterized membrane protein